MDILDVWFESGSSFGVLENTRGHVYPADLYLEGGDQYRGWFHSSLLVGVSYKESSPYKKVLTHGWVLDRNGKAMSKSQGNIISPQEIIQEKGAEILRLWVAMVNYKEDIRLGDEILSRVVESYRKIRNTWKFMIGVVNDFDPDKDSSGFAEFSETDIYILHKLEDLKESVLRSYRKFEFHTIYHSISNFFIVDLSSFYLSIIKDNLYCNGKDSIERRAARTVVFRLLTETVLLLAPILSFTAEEVWEHMPPFSGKERSVHLHTFPSIDRSQLNSVNLKKWEDLHDLRNSILKSIENARNEKIIGDSLESDIELSLEPRIYNELKNEKDLIKAITVVSGLEIIEGESEKITIRKYSGHKCPRCWNWFRSEEGSGHFPELCSRCNETVKEMKLGAY